MSDLTDARMAQLDVIADASARSGRKPTALPRDRPNIERWAQDLGYREGQFSRESRKKETT